MSRTYRTHVPPAKLKHRRRPLALSVRSHVGLAAIERSGSGFHGRDRRAERKAVRRKLRQGQWD